VEVGEIATCEAEMTSGAHRSERLLGGILDSMRAAMVLVGETGTIVYTNPAARELFFGGEDVEGQNFLQMLASASEPLRRPLLSETDQIFTFDDGGDPETYHLSKKHFPLDGEPHTLITVRHMTQEISRQEIAVLKKTLRIIGHELANSMAPATSLLRSAKALLSRPDHHEQLVTALGTIEERLVHLQGFLTGLAHLGQLPRPRKREVAWAGFVDGLRALWPDLAISPPPAPTGWFDPAQLQQVLINLVKNADEAGGPRTGTSIEIEAASEGGVRVTVHDRGQGMSDELLKKALVPAFTTKEHGSGMGLALCREIIDAHDGRLRISRRDGGGTSVSLWLPGRTIEPAASRARLTLTGVR
jgi:two-component system nitrogen regulation sensor histidine kinase NtrY